MASIGDLMGESWDTFKKSLLHLFVFNLISWVVLGVVILVGVLIAAFSGVGIGLFGQQENLALTRGLIVVVAIEGLVVVIFTIAWVMLVQIGNMLIVSEKGQISLDATIKRSIPFILPAFWVGIVGIILIFGGYVAFIIPGIILSLFFFFYSYEIVFAGKHGLDALRSSMSIVTQNFWGIFGRLLLLIVIIFAIEIVFFIIGGISALPIVLLGKNSIAGGFFYIIIQIISYIFGTLLGFFIVSYYYILYRHAKDAAQEKLSSLLWPTIIAVVGWVIFILIMFVVGASGLAALKSGALQKMMDSSKTQTTTINNVMEEEKKVSPADEFIKAGTLKLSTANQLAEKVNLTEDDKAQIRGLINGALDDFNTATQKDPENYQTWYYRGEAYKKLIGVATNADTFTITSYKKAIEINPNDSAVYLALGGVYYQMKDYDNAIFNFQQVVKLQPNYANGYYNLGVAYKKVGAKTEAKKALQKALDLLPANDSTRYKAEAELESL